MIDWQKAAQATIDSVHESLPADADLQTRKKALRDAWPYPFAATSWGRKVRAKYTRAYLEKFGLPPLKSKSVEHHLSPLERLMQAAERSMQ